VFERLFTRPEPQADLTRIGLRNAASLYARQLASQATAAALPGPGPILSDEFPMLENEAPRAFFMGNLSTWLFEFDERTWQALLASSEKSRTLAAMEPVTVADIVYPFDSMNAELMDYLNRRLPGGQGAATQSSAVRPGVMPCLFRKLETSIPNNNAPTQPNPLELIFGQLETRLHEHPENWSAIADEFLLLCQRPVSRTLSFEGGRRYAAFAAATANAALNHQDWPRAQRLIEIGRRLRPDSAVFPYLLRIKHAHTQKPWPNDQ
jgi:hypothetical protein